MSDLPSRAADWFRLPATLAQELGEAAVVQVGVDRIKDL